MSDSAGIFGVLNKQLIKPYTSLSMKSGRATFLLRVLLIPFLLYIVLMLLQYKFYFPGHHGELVNLTTVIAFFMLIPTFIQRLNDLGWSRLMVLFLLVLPVAVALVILNTPEVFDWIKSMRGRVEKSQHILMAVWILLGPLIIPVVSIIFLASKGGKVMQTQDETTKTINRGESSRQKGMQTIMGKINHITEDGLGKLINVMRKIPGQGSRGGSHRTLFNIGGTEAIMYSSDEPDIREGDAVRAIGRPKARRFRVIAMENLASKKVYVEAYLMFLVWGALTAFAGFVGINMSIMFADTLVIAFTIFMFGMAAYCFNRFFVVRRAKAMLAEAKQDTEAELELGVEAEDFSTIQVQSREE